MQFILLNGQGSCGAVWSHRPPEQDVALKFINLQHPVFQMGKLNSERGRDFFKYRKKQNEIEIK